LFGKDTASEIIFNRIMITSETEGIEDIISTLKI